MSSRRPGLLAATAATAALALTACSSNVSGSGSTAAPGSSGGGSSTGSSSTGTSSTGTSAAPGTGSSSTGSSSGGGSPAGPAGTAEALASLLQQGLATTTSAHIALQITTGGQTITGSGDERLSAGKLIALNLTESVPGAGAVQVIQTDGKTYVKLPGTQNTSGKPYALVSPTSSNPEIRGLATSLNSTQSSASAGSAGILAAAANSVKAVGTETIGGVSATHYAIVVDTTQLPATYPGRAALIQAGVTSLPVDIYLDSSNHPVQVTENFTAAGEAVATKISISNYNKPVTITAPPASQVSTN